MSRRFRYYLGALAITAVVIAALPFHVAITEWMLAQGEVALSYCGQFLGGAPTGDAAPR